LGWTILGALGLAMDLISLVAATEPQEGRLNS
jgi:hypothetical protein